MVNKKNATLEAFESESNFASLINFLFMRYAGRVDFPEEYEEKRMPRSVLEKMPETEGKRNVIEREFMRDNTYVRYGFDIYKFPFVVFFEDGKSDNYLEFFKSKQEAYMFCEGLLDKGIYSLLILIMNFNIEAEVFR